MGTPEIGKESEALRFTTLIEDHLKYSLGKQREQASAYDLFRSIALTARQYLIDGMFHTRERVERQQPKRLYYLSMEFLIGQSLVSNLRNLRLFQAASNAAAQLQLDLTEVAQAEPDAALGNGGLGRLAACFLESLASLGMPGYGYGINYEYGLFRQEIDNGYQEEWPDHWASEQSPWIIERMEDSCVIPLYGRATQAQDRFGNFRPKWSDWRVLIGVPSDLPIAGYGGETVNFLRLYSARASDSFDIRIFNDGDYIRATLDKIESERISKVLYPSDNVAAGRELRLVQEYFLVACAVRDIFRRYLRGHSTFDAFPDKVAIQMNDTHPALAIAELIRMFVDEHGLPWEKAWELTRATCGYTNHTLLPEALEKWPVGLMGYVLPRHLQIIYDINAHFLREVSEAWPGDADRLRDMSLIEEGHDKQVRMAHLAVIGSHSINGVAKLHSELLRKQLLPKFYEMWPERFNNKTNGITHRRWLMHANPRLSELISGAIGDGWIRDLTQLKLLEPFATDAAFQQRFLEIKRENKQALTAMAARRARTAINPDSLFDVQVKRIHEYKRQLLNAMHIIHHYLEVVEDGRILQPRTYVFAGKAAPGYYMAKLIIKFINNLARVINNDARVLGAIRIVFIPDYKVSVAETIIPAAEVSEQISTAGMEASGTGNMKLAMNGALTIGTLDGANIEIREEVGDENMYIFGLTAEQVQRMRETRSYNPYRYYETNPLIRHVVDAIGSNLFCPSEPGLFRPIYEKLLYHGDPYFHLADFEAYIATHERISRDYADSREWARRAILNVARMGKFSSDRTVRQYADEIWDIHPLEP